jgi:succinyl-CoA synthetase beta subunit
MAKLTEFESKKIIKQAGIAVPRGELVSTPRQAEEVTMRIGLPVVLKIQSLYTGRFEKDLIKIVSSVEDLKRTLDYMFDVHCSEIKLQKLLVEEKYIYQNEYYLSVISDDISLSPLILFSENGGIDIEKNSENIVGRPLNILNGVTGEDISFLTNGASVNSDLGDVIKKLYDVYRKMDCCQLEINPLVFSEEKFVALDAKIIIDGDALYRHKELGVQLTEENLNREPTSLEISAAKIDENDHRGTVHIAELDQSLQIKGTRIAINCVGTGVSLSIMDELIEQGYMPANFGDTSGNPTASKLYRAIRLIFSQKDIKGFVFASCVSSQQLDNTARGVIKALKDIYPETGGKPGIPCVFMFRGAWDKDAMLLFKEHGISDSENVIMLGRDSNEYNVACEFDKLYKTRKSVPNNVKNVRV